MARVYAKLKTSIWGDDDFRALTADAQWLYQHLFSHPKIDISGVTEWHPGKIATKAADMTVERVLEAARVLIAARFIVIDPGAGEVLVRSFIRHDESMKSPKTAKGVMNAWADISSDLIRTVIAHEVVRIRDEHPDWSGCAEVHLKVVAKASGYSPDTLSTPYPEVSERHPDDTPSIPPRYQVEGVSETDPILLIANGYQQMANESVDDAAGGAPDDPQALLPDPRPDATSLCEHLARRIAENGSRKPTIGKAWHDAARLLLDRDRRDPDEAHHLIDWCQDDEFWRTNILSMSKFRTQYDKLRLQAQRRNQTQATTQPGGIDWAAAMQRAQILDQETTA